MKHTLYIIIVLISYLCTGCTHNNGDIGPWFGTWKLESITIDGSIDQDYAKNDNMVWKFQSSVIEMQEILPMHTTADHFGTWMQTSNTTVEMQFIYHDIQNPTGWPYYAPPAASHLPSGTFVMEILELSSKRIRLKYTADTGIVFIYSLKKW